MMTRKQLSKVCTKAADVILRDGFLKNSLGENDGPKCAVGALRFAGHEDVDTPFSVEDGAELVTLFRRTRPRSKFFRIADYSDADRRRKHDVIQLLQDMARAALE